MAAVQAYKEEEERSAKIMKIGGIVLGSFFALCVICAVAAAVIYAVFVVKDKMKGIGADGDFIEALRPRPVGLPRSEPPLTMRHGPGFVRNE